MVTFFMEKFLGLEILVWIIVGVQLLIGTLIFAFIKREYIKGKFYKIFWKEKVIKVFIHYETGRFKLFWRLIPLDEKFNIQDSLYKYHDRKVIKPHDTFLIQSETEKEKFTIIIDGKTYTFKNEKAIKGKTELYPEIHYSYNNPDPIEFFKSLKKDEMSSQQLRDYEQNLLWSKLLNIESEKMMILFCIILGIINLVASVLILCNINGWIVFHK